MPFRTTAELAAGLDHVKNSPKSQGTVTLIVRRPATGEREVLEEGVLDLVEGLAGDNWKARGSPRTADGSADPERQLTVMSSRAIALVETEEARWPLAGDQLFIDLDLSVDNLPAGSRLSIGDAIIEVSAVPHNGCKKFTERFGLEATEFLSSPGARGLRLRGINAKVIVPGVVRAGDVVKVAQPAA